MFMCGFKVIDDKVEFIFAYYNFEHFCLHVSVANRRLQKIVVYIDAIWPYFILIVCCRT